MPTYELICAIGQFSMFNKMESKIIKSKEARIKVTDANLLDGEYLAVDAIELKCIALDKSELDKGILHASYEFSGKGWPGSFVLDQFDSTTAIRIVLDSIAAEKNTRRTDSINTRKIYYSFYFEKAGRTYFQPTWTYWDTKSKKIAKKVLSIDTLEILVPFPKPRIPIEKTIESSRDIVILVDLSSSMLTQDFEPNRIEFVKTYLKTIIKDKKAGDRISLVGFANESYQFCNFTSDNQLINNLIAELKLGMLEDGTALGDAILVALKQLKSSSASTKTIVLFTDFTNNSGVISPNMSAELAGASAVNITAVVIGTNGQVKGPIARKPNGGYIYDMVDSKVDLEAIKELSTLSGGVFYQLDPKILKNLSYESLLEKSDKMPNSNLNNSIIDLILKE